MRGFYFYSTCDDHGWLTLWYVSRRRQSRLSHCPFFSFRFSASLGIELTMESSLTFHLSNRFDIPIADAAAYASLFGLMNIFSRGLGGLISDKMHKVYSLRGRLSIHMAFMLIEGVLMICFIQSATMNFTLATMILFAIFGQVRAFAVQWRCIRAEALRWTPLSSSSLCHLRGTRCRWGPFSVSFPT
jgi:nitrate/nitrite transporter NarK